jgi:hypothetical protein
MPSQIADSYKRSRKVKVRNQEKLKRITPQKVWIAPELTEQEKTLLKVVYESEWNLLSKEVKYLT